MYYHLTKWLLSNRNCDRKRMEECIWTFNYIKGVNLGNWLVLEK